VLLEQLERRVPSLASVTAPSATLAARALERPASLYLPAAYDEVSARVFAEGQIVVLDHKVRFDGGGDWWMPEVPGIGRLFQFHLHYHDWLVPLAVRAGSGDDEARRRVERILRDWLQVCDPRDTRALRNAWHPFVISTRLISWGRILAAAPAIAGADQEGLGPALASSIRSQARRLTARLERDVCGNHLLRNATGLAWAAHLLDGNAALETARLAAALVREQILEQVLDDGGHVERSPAYHVHVMQDLLDLASILTDEAVAAEVRLALDRMDGWLAEVLHPDGDVPLFNDATLLGVEKIGELRRGVAALLGRPASSPQPGLTFLRETGLVVHRDSMATTIVDVGPVGPDWQPGHAHADTLTLELSIGGVRCIVDPGTFGYAADDRRAYDRATSSHNCATVDGRDSTEVWSVFRVGSRARPTVVEVSESPPQVRAGHDGLRSVNVERVVRWRSGVVEVEDHLRAPKDGMGSGGWLFGPGWAVESQGLGIWRAKHDTGRVVDVTISTEALWHADLRVTEWHPRIGVVLPALRIEWSQALTAGRQAVITTRFKWDCGGDDLKP
jgi:uncharacterized heparinase superfamily protein